MRHLFLLREFVRRDFESRYAGSMLGFAWSLVQPAWQLVLFTFVFSAVLKIPLTGERTANFGIFLFCGLIPWLAVNEGVIRSTTAITDNASLVKKIHFPSEILVLSVVLAAVIHQGITIAVFLAVLALLGELHAASLPVLLIALPLQIGLTLGLGLVAATVNTFVRDVAQVLGMAMMAWFYLTPIVYPASQVPADLAWVAALNPMASIVQLNRAAFLGAGLSGIGDPTPLLVATTVALLAGFWLFRRSRPYFADEL
jgi:lipopolysaccharide transport system permease protein